jgi:hypothetical protein
LAGGTDAPLLVYVDANTGDVLGAELGSEVNARK